MESMGVHGCKEVYRLPHITYPYSSCICISAHSIPTFCNFTNGITTPLQDSIGV